MAHDDRHDAPAGTPGPTDEDSRRRGYDPAHDRQPRGTGAPRPGADGTLDAVRDPGRDDHLATGSGGGDWESSAAGIGERRGPIDTDRPFGPGPQADDDAALQAGVHARLARETGLDAGDVSVTVENGQVTLVGTVADRPTKHAIESLVDRCPGVRGIDNRIKVMLGGLPLDPDAPPTPRASVPADSPTARDEAIGRHSEPTSDRSGYYG